MLSNDRYPITHKERILADDGANLSPLSNGSARLTVERIGTGRYELEIELGKRVGRVVLRDVYYGVTFADSEYRYSAFVEHGQGITRLEGLWEPSLDEELPDRGGKIVSITGRLGEPDGEVSVQLRHRLYVPEEGEFLEEILELSNVGGVDLGLRDYRFAFRKRLEKPKTYGGPGIDIENYRLIALPFRLQPDGKKHDYQLDDVYNGRYQCSVFHNPMELTQQVVDEGRGRSEGWAWTDGENGLLLIKYNPKMIEYSMLETEHVDGATYLNFGGASPSLYGEPAEARDLHSGGRVAFGLTRCHFYEGLWRRGSYIFREYMSGLGHGLPDNYDPSVHWNELYDVGWYHSDRQRLFANYTPQALEQEARKAREIGCEALYLDPGWETCEGATKWDEERLGPAAEFVRKIQDEYGLQVGFRTIGRSYCEEYQGMYRRSADGSIGFAGPYGVKPFYEPCICSEAYQTEKLKRILDVAGAGMRFIMFDEFDWRGPCFDPRHGHPVPTTPSMHAHAVMDLARKVHEAHPEILIEAHDPVWPWAVRYLPVYYLHEQGTFDEGWAFEFMWNPLEDLLSGKALSLFYYNLAYDLPLYLHITMEHDNDNCLAFWWYASTVRHLGIGGSRGNQARFEAYKAAMAQYRSLKDLYTCGEFYAIDELTHIHVLPETDRCVLNAFNLTDTPVSRQVEVRLNDLGLMENLLVDGAPHQIIGGKLVLDLEIPPFAPIVVNMHA